MRVPIHNILIIIIIIFTILSANVYNNYFKYTIIIMFPLLIVIK